MKKILIVLGLIASLSASAASHAFLPFLTPNSTTSLKNSDYETVQVTNGTTLSLMKVPAFISPQAGIAYYILGNNYPSLAYTPTAALFAYSTNYIGGLTNSGGIGTTGLGYTNVTQVGSMISSYNPLAYQLFGTNEFLIQYTSGVSNSAGNTVASPFLPVTVPAADANGCINTNLVLVFGIAGDSTSCTNTTNQIIYARSYDGNVYDMVNTNSVSITANGTNEVIGSIQPSAAWLAGVKTIAIYSIAFGTNTSSTNTFLTKAGIATYVP